jgi:hypothetical protein
MLRLAYNEMIQKQSDISARLADINQHFAERIKVEILETLDIVQKINAATLPHDKVKLYQDWLKFFSQRRMEDLCSTPVAETTGWTTTTSSRFGVDDGYPSF